MKKVNFNIIGRRKNFILTLIVTLLLAILFFSITNDIENTFFEVQIKSSEPIKTQIYFDYGSGYSEEASALIYLNGNNHWQKFNTIIPKFRELKRIRFDPTNQDSIVLFKDILLKTVEKKIDLSEAKFENYNQVVSLKKLDNNEFMITPTGGAFDAYFDFSVNTVAESNHYFLFKIISRILFLQLICIIFFKVMALIINNTIFDLLIKNLINHKPYKLLFATSIIGVVISSFPIIFLGKSYVSPNNGPVALAYSKAPTISSAQSSEVEAALGADVGAMAWYHFSATNQEKNSVFDDLEFPLWNRYNGTGISLIGQGQAMIGDPLNWLVILGGGNSLPFDIKFLFLKVVFSMSLSLLIFEITKSSKASLIVAFTSSFITYFSYRLNHAAIFSLCYSPLVLISWFYFYKNHNSRFASIMLLLSNIFLLSSGTVKEAYMLLICINFLGIFGIFFINEVGMQKKLKIFCSALVLMLSMVMISMPLWGTLLNMIQNSWSSYDMPAAQFFPWNNFLGFADNIFNVVKEGRLRPGINILLFIGILIAITNFSKKHISNDKRLKTYIFFLILFLFCIGMAYGIFPEKYIIKIPFLNNIHHIDNTFSTCAIIFSIVLSGIGFSKYFDNIDSRKIKLYIFIYCVFSLLFSTFFYGYKDYKAILVSGIYLFISIGMCIYILEFINARCGKVYTYQISIFALALLLVLGRGASWGPVTDYYDKYFFNPKERADLLYESDVIAKAKKNFLEPIRFISVGEAVFSGYRATIGLESIDGPDALQSKTYQKLIKSLGLPYVWEWRMGFDQGSVISFKQSLAFLGVGGVFSETRLEPPEFFNLVAQDSRLFFYEIPRPWPRAFYTNNIFEFDSAEEFKNKVLSGDIFIAFPKTNLSDTLNQKIALANKDKEPITIVPAESYRLTANRTFFNVDVPAAGFIYLGEADEEGSFEVYLNGKRWDYFSANVAFKAIFVDKPGKYHVEVRYWPKFLTLYLFISLIGSSIFLHHIYHKKNKITN